MSDEISNGNMQMESQLYNSIKMLLDAMPLCYIIFSKDGDLIYCNQESVILFSLQSQQEVKDKFYELSPLYQHDGSLSKEAFIKNVENAFDNGEIHFEWSFQNFSCEYIPSQVTLVPTKMLDYNFVVCFINDLREIKASQAELRESDNRNYAVFKSLPLSCSFWDRNFKITDCNNETIKLFDLPDKKSYLQKFHDLSPEYQPDGRLSREKMVEMIKIAFEKGNIRFEWMHQKLTGEQIPVEVTLVRIKRYKKNILVGYTRDLRELKEKMSMLEHLEKLALIDDLTNIHNRRYFVNQAEHILSADDTQPKDISVMMIDIDWFKRVNDTYGHQVGDDVLKKVASIIKSEIRSDDLLARYGGEEFIILAKIDSEHAEVLAERIRYRINSHYFKFANSKFRITVSIGLMTRKDETLSLDECINLADSALYKAKKNGRNYVIITAPDGV